MSTRALIAALLVLASIATGAPAQQAARVPRVGVLEYDAATQRDRFVAFFGAMEAGGYAPGRTVSYVTRSADGNFDRLPDLAAELVAAGVDVIVTASPPAVRAAQKATSRIPIVMIVHNPVGLGVAKSLAQPGGNVTGIAFQDSELSVKRLDTLRQMVPGLTRVAVIWNREGGGPEAVQAVEAAGRSLGILLLPLEVRDAVDFVPALDCAKAWHAQAVVQLASPFITRNRRTLIDLLRAHRLPATCEMRQYVLDGCLMTYGANLDGMFRDLAPYVARILRGASPAELAISQPKEFDFAVNLGTAQLLGLAIPMDVRMRATEIVP